MRNFWILFKVNFLNTFGINKLSKKLGSKNTFFRLGMPILIVFLGLLIFAGIFFYMYIYSEIFHIAQNYYGLLLLGVVVASVFCFFISLQVANSYLYGAKDLDLLMSLPISNRSIIASKLSNLLFINYLMFWAIFIPSMAMYIYYTKDTSLMFYVGSVITLLIGPLIVITISCFIAYFLGILMSKFKHKNIIQTFLLFIITLVFMFSMFSMSAAPDEEYTDLANMMVNLLEKIYYPGILVVRGMLGEILPLLIFVGISVIPFMIFIYIIAHNFIKANARARATYTDKNFQLREQNVGGQFGSLMKREFRRYFSSSLVVMNTAIGPVLGTIMVIVMLTGQQYVEVIDMILLEHPDLFIAVLIGLSLFCNGIISTTASSISLEGKYFWIIKSSPLTEKQVFYSKICLNFLIGLPFIIINTIVISIVLTPEFYEIFMLLFIPIVFNLVCGIIGIIINVTLPKMEWDAEVKVVKQSMSTMLNMFSTLIFLALVTVAFVRVLVPRLSMMNSYFVILLALIVILFVLNYVMNTYGKNKYLQIKA